MQRLQYNKGIMLHTNAEIWKKKKEREANTYLKLKK